MKLIPLLSLVALTYAAPLAEESVVENTQAESPMAALYSSSEQGVRVLPRIIDDKIGLKPGSRRHEVPYGPWAVTKQMASKMKTDVRTSICAGECLVTAMQATIRYTDGTEANINNNAWLHHIALFGSGAGGGSLWACGNERPTLRLDTTEKYGIAWPATWLMVVDLMTEETAPKNIGLHIMFEYVPVGAAGYKAATMYWLTIGEPYAKNGVYSFRTQTSRVTAGGKLLYTIGHMHDGGTDMRLYINGAKTPTCKSIMHYNARPGYNPPGGAGGMAGMSHSNAINTSDAPLDAGANHISDPGACLNFGTVKAGDTLSAEAWYDANKYPLMVHNGKKENLMGNMRVYIGT